MATYKKRGGKIKSGQQQAPEQDSVTAEVFTSLDSSAGRAEACAQKWRALCDCRRDGWAKK